jgi:hypothetical protein
MSRNAAKFDDPRVRRPPADQHRGPKLLGIHPHCVHVDPAGDGIDSVATAFVDLSGKVQLHAVRKVTAVGQVEAE